VVVLCLAHAALAAACVPVHAEQDTQAPARARVIASARVTQTERLAILSQERNDVLERLAKATKEGDALAITRLRGDVAALDREIASVGRAPAYDTKVPAPTQRAAKVSAERPVDESEPAASETTYASWDVFKNFGKGSKQ
jgi:hypothetical protein